MNAFFQKIKTAFLNLSQAARVAVIGGGVAGLALIIGVSAYALGKTYLLNPEIDQISQMIPRQAIFFVEVRNPARLLEMWSESGPAQRLANSPAYANLKSTPEVQNLTSLVYFLELKTGSYFGDFISVLDRPAGFAYMQDGTFLAVTRTNVQSRLGIAVAQAFETGEGRTIELPNQEQFEKAPPKDTASEEPYVVKQEDSLPALIERRERLGNLQISEIDLGERSIYFALLDDVLFASDSIETLESSLSLAGDPESYSLATLAGMPAARSSLAADDGHALIYFGSSGGFWAPAAATLGGDAGLALVLKTNGADTAQFDSFDAGESRLARFRKDDGRQELPARTHWEHLLPREAVLSFYSAADSPAELLEYLENISGPPESIANNAQKMLRAGGLSTDELKGDPGTALIFHGFTWNAHNLTPQLSFGFRGDADQLGRLTTAVFRPGDAARSITFQNTAYTIYPRSGKNYEPAFAAVQSAKASGGAAFLSTRDDVLKTIIGSAAGIRPDLSDLKSYTELGEFAGAPMHVVVDLNEARLALRAFFKLGALRSDAYSEKTLDRDIQPFLDAFAGYGILHLAHGLPGRIHGRLVITRN